MSRWACLSRCFFGAQDAWSEFRRFELLELGKRIRLLCLGIKYPQPLSEIALHKASGIQLLIPEVVF